jgi:hypothetical protein
VVFIGAGLLSAVSPAASASVRFGPDVFTDALVLFAGAVYPRLNFPDRTICPQELTAGTKARCGLHGDADPHPVDATAVAMVIASPNGRVNRIPRFREKPRKT